MSSRWFVDHEGRIFDEFGFVGTLEPSISAARREAFVERITDLPDLEYHRGLHEGEKLLQIEDVS